MKGFARGKTTSQGTQVIPQVEAKDGLESVRS